MLAVLAAALQLAAAQIAAPPPGDQPAAPGAEEIPPPAPPPEAEPSAPSPKEPPAPSPKETPPPARKESATAPKGPSQLSLLSGESLRGGSAGMAWAGWSSLGVAYAIGFSQVDDGGLYLDHDWAKSETRIGALYRRQLSPAGSFDVAARLALAWYENFGATWVYEDNHSDRGFELSPGLSLSRHGGGGIFSAIVEAPMTVTTKYKSGFLFSPSLSFAFEVPLYPQVTVGALAGLGYRAGAGGAPLKEGQGELRFLVVAGYQLL